MKSVIKITLGVEIVLRTILAIGGILFSLILLIQPLFAFDELINGEDQEIISIIRFASLVFLIIGVLSLFIAIICLKTTKKIETVKSKKQLIVSIILSFICTAFIPSLLLLFTPSKYYIKEKPYFE